MHMIARPAHSEGRPGEANTSKTVYARALGFIKRSSMYSTNSAIIFS